jgi:Zn-dependent protease with chaperone function
MDKVFLFKHNASKPSEVELNFNDLNSTLEIDGLGGEYPIIWEYGDLLIENTHTFLSISNARIPEIYIHSYNKNINLKIKSIHPTSIRNKWYERLFNAGIYVHLGVTAFCISLIGLMYFFIMPSIVDTLILKLPIYYDEQIGYQVFENIKYTSSIDTTKSKLLNEFYAELDKSNTRNIDIVVVDNSIQNAFALPDGHIIVYSGILNSMENYTELAALLGHESAHVYERHSMRLLGKNISAYIIVSLILNDINGAMAVLIDNANAINSLTYSRGFEQESDEKSMQLLMKNNIDITGMKKLIEMLKKNEMLEIPEFLSTHPISSNRIEYLNNFIDKNKNRYSKKENSKLKELFEKLK